MPAPDSKTTGGASDIGCVVIGRNEGRRLTRCLESVATHAGHVVYVDSGSTDGSEARAREFGAEVVALDMSVPFTAARARNAGFRALMAAHPEIAFVQFVDGDSEIQPGWLDYGAEHLRTSPRTAVASGRQRERNPDLTPFNRMLDIEWDTPRGVVKSCCGNAMMRASVFAELGGFRDELIAGEEPELSVRIRRAGHLVEALDPPMAVHDVGTMRLRQWWRRAMRGGHAFAEGKHLHGAPPERHCVQQVRRILFWAGVLPVAAVGAAPFTAGLSLLALPLGYGYTWSRVRSHMIQRGRGARDARLAATLITLGKFAEIVGVFRFHTSRLLGLRRTLIEYKDAGST